MDAVKKTKEPEQESPRMTISALRSFVQRLKVIAAHHDITISEALDKYATAGVDREYKRVVAALGESFDLGGESGGA